MWGSLPHLFKFIPYGLLCYSPLSLEVSLKKPPKFRYYSLLYFLYFGSYAICLPIHIIFRLLLIPLTLPFKAIHFVTLVLAICAVTVTIVLSYTIFERNDKFIVLFNTLCKYQRKTFGKAIQLMCITQQQYYKY